MKKYLFVILMLSASFSALAQESASEQTMKNRRFFVGASYSFMSVDMKLSSLSLHSVWFGSDLGTRDLEPGEIDTINDFVNRHSNINALSLEAGMDFINNPEVKWKFSGTLLLGIAQNLTTVQNNETGFLLSLGKTQIQPHLHEYQLMLFGECMNKSSDGYYHVQYGEYHFDNDNMVMDGFNGAMFQSDFWCVSPEYKYSPDLDNDITYPGISSLWTLVGIVDGPPPVTMNWHKWDSTWGYPVYPTMMELESDSSGTTEFTTQSQNEWSAGLSVDVKSKRDNYLYEGSISGKLKFSQTFEKTVSSSQTHSVTYTSPFNLDEESQVYGYYLYVIPEIKRFSYSMFPWWNDPAKQQYRSLPERGPRYVQPGHPLLV